ncbi:MAG: hypothetical protein HRT38_09615 [Alteromonadaceae bacterium]|nr:hypothetical protein [Alteromonadaceae bacterium]
MLQKLSVKCKNKQRKVERKVQCFVSVGQYNKALVSFLSEYAANLYCLRNLMSGLGYTEQQAEIVYE